MDPTETVTSPGPEARPGSIQGGDGLGEKLLSSARRQLSEFEAELGLARAKAAELSEALAPTAQHARNLEDLCARFRSRIAELEAQCVHLTRTICARDAEVERLAAAAGRAAGERDALAPLLAQAEARFFSLKASFSWRITLPLRWVRRRLPDRWKSGSRRGGP
jgi:septal ring factor EnvC (AmiA/AmiB activator)